MAEFEISQGQYLRGETLHPRIRRMNIMESRMTSFGMAETLCWKLPASLLAGGCCLFALVACGQGSFQNLDFEAGPVYEYTGVTPPPVYSDVLPFWTVRFNDEVQPGANCNEFTLDVAAVALMSADGFWGPDYVIAGDRSVYLQAAGTDLFDPPGSAINVSISQVGTVPQNAQWLIFDVRNQWYDYFPRAPGPFEVNVGGTEVPMVPIQSEGPNVTFAGNIAAWAGQTRELSIGVVVPQNPPPGGLWEGWAVVDSIRFAVPEPTSATLLLLGLLGVWRCRGHARRGINRHLWLR